MFTKNNRAFLRRPLKIFLRLSGCILLLFLLYFLIAILFSWITVNSDFRPCEKESVEVFITTNGVHTDIAVPLINEVKDWTTCLDPLKTRAANRFVNYVSFGWGDKGFYLETKRWADLKFSTAFKAMFFMSTTAMHVSFYETRTENENCRKICISKESYRQIADYIQNSFDVDGKGCFQLIKDASYGNNDLFYEAKGVYSFLETCNTWANSGLKEAGMKACLWTPFDKGIFYQYSGE